MRTSRAVSIAAILTSCWLSSARADIQDHSNAELISYAALLAATGVSVVANTVEVIQGDGSKLWGWMGFAAGSLLVIIDAQDGNAAELTVAGALTAGLGVWSLVLSYRDKPGGGRNSELRLAPSVAYRGVDQVEPRIALTLDL